MDFTENLNMQKDLKSQVNDLSEKLGSVTGYNTAFEIKLNLLTTLDELIDVVEQDTIVNDFLSNKHAHDSVPDFKDVIVNVYKRNLDASKIGSGILNWGRAHEYILTESLVPTINDANDKATKNARVSIAGLDITIENPRGSERTGVDPSGQSWTSYMHDDYGYINRTLGADKEHIDVFVGHEINNQNIQNVYVVNQRDPITRKFDEHKVMLGYDSLQSARKRYKMHYAKDWTGLDSIVELSIAELRAWLKNGNKAEPVRSAKQGKLMRQFCKMSG